MSKKSEWISKKVRLLRREGKSQKQALGQAYGMYRQKMKDAKKGKRK